LYRFLLLVGLITSQLLPTQEVFSATGSGSELLEATRALYKGNLEYAVSLAKNYVRAHPREPGGLTILARIEISQGRYDLAFQHLRKALQADPGSVDALYYLGAVCQALAQEQFRQMFAIAPDSARSHEFLARSYRAEGKTDEAMEEYRATLRGNPDSVEALNALGDMEWFQSHMDEAISYYTRASAINPRDFHSVYATGAAYLRQRDDERAADSFRRALALVPDSAMAHLGLGQALLRTGDADAAVVELRTAIELEPITEVCYAGGCRVSNQSRQAYILLGRAYQKLGRSPEAAAAFHKAEELTTQRAESHQRLDHAEDFVPESPGITQ